MDKKQITLYTAKKSQKGSKPVPNTLYYISMPKLLPPQQTQFINYYHQYFPAIYRYIGFRVGSRHQTEDLVSEVFLKALEHYSRYKVREHIPFSSWLFKIAKNTLTDFYRKNKKKTLNIEDIPEMIDLSPLPHTQVDTKFLFLKVKEIVDTLPKKQKEIVTLRLFGELKNKEIAEILSLSEKTIASTYMRAIAKISSRLTFHL